LTGVTALAVPIDNFCWLQTKGIAAVLTEGTLVIGKACVPSISTTDGAVAPETVTGTDEIRVGKVVNVEATTEFSLIDLGLD